MSGLPRRILRFFLLGLAGLLVLFLGVVAAVYVYVAQDLPSVRPLRTPEGITAVMEPSLAATTERARRAYRPVEFAELPPHMTDAFTAPYGDFMRGDLARTLLTHGSQGRRHLYSAVLVLHLEVLLSREELVTAWLNSRYFGNRVYGIEAAARFYFQKGATDLTLDEAALLAAIAYAPSRLTPDRDPEALLRRREKVLAAMRDKGFITAEQEKIAALMPIIPPTSSVERKLPE